MSDLKFTKVGDEAILECKPNDIAEWHPLVEWTAVGPRIIRYPSDFYFPDEWWESQRKKLLEAMLEKESEK